MAIPPGHLGRCPICEHKMEERSACIIDSAGPRFVMAYVCFSGKHPVGVTPIDGIRVERDLARERSRVLGA